MNDCTAQIMREKERCARLEDENRLLRDENKRLKESCDQWQELARCMSQKLNTIKETAG